jgi:hypothetical protein
LFAQDLIDVLDGHLAQLSTSEQAEVWTSLRDALVKGEDDPQAPRGYQKFRNDVAGFLEKRRITGCGKRKAQEPAQE